MSHGERQLLVSRAVEAVIWGVPAVNYRLMFEAAVRAGMDGPNQVVLWPGRLDWHNQTLTPNPDVVYLMVFYDTSAGPVVLEIPPAGGGSITGSVMNCWQAPIEDVGPAGVDRGEGGRYLVTPPGWTEPVPDGYLALPSDTLTGYGLLRSIIAGTGDQDVEAAVQYARQVRIYPIAEAGDPPAPTFVEVDNTLFDAAIPWDATFFDVLDVMIQVEPWLERDRVMIDLLRTVGIERGRPFTVDAEVRAVLGDAAAQARELLDGWYQQANVPFATGAHWGVPVRPEYLHATEDRFAGPDRYDVDARAITFTFGYFSARHLGSGQFYLMSTQDAAGEPLDGARDYVLTVPADPPVSQYWAVTVYDRDTHTLLRDVPRPGRSSNSEGLVTNDDGTVTLHFGPGDHLDNPNWIPTTPGRRYEIIFRLYGPEPALFDKTWQLPDLERRV